MNFARYMDDSNADFVAISMSLLKRVREGLYGYEKMMGTELRKELNGMSRGRIKSILRDMESKKIESENEELFENEVLCKVFFILESYGFKNVAKDLGVVVNAKTSKDLSQGLIYQKIAEGASHKSRSVAASGSRHPEKEKIIDVIRETWKTFPWGSKNKMISYVMGDYRVVERTLKNWMKEEGLAPLEEVKKDKYHLIIPEKWKKTPGAISAIT